jgi:hypothetical protein
MNNTPPELVPDLKDYDDMGVEGMSRRLIQDTEINASKMEQGFLEELGKINPSAADGAKELIGQLRAKIAEIEFAYSKCERCGDDINRAHYRGQDASFSSSLQAELKHLKGQLEQRCWDLRGIHLELQDLVSKLENEDNHENLSEV